VPHAFTHFDLLIHPVWVSVTAHCGVADAADALWYNAARPAPVGLPAPIVQLLQEPP
jgi:adenine-specific DNA glycosylase